MFVVKMFANSCRTRVQVFEDNLDTWMQGFHRLLTLPDPVKALFAPSSDDDRLSSMHAMQRSVCEVILLYADKVTPHAMHLHHYHFQSTNWFFVMR